MTYAQIMAKLGKEWMRSNQTFQDFTKENEMTPDEARQFLSLCLSIGARLDQTPELNDNELQAPTMRNASFEKPETPHRSGISGINQSEKVLVLIQPHGKEKYFSFARYTTAPHRQWLIDGHNGNWDNDVKFWQYLPLVEI